MPDPFRRSAVAVGGSASAAPAVTTVPSNVGGGTTGLIGGRISFDAARNEISDATAGRVTLAILDLILLGLITFYVVTKSAQGAN